MTNPLPFINKVYENLGEDDLKALARDLATHYKEPYVLCFYGDLGVGKSTFCRSFIQTFMNAPDHIVPSPTFTLIQEYIKDELPLYHFDFYRLNNPNDLVELNFDEALSTGLCLIEWPEIVEDYLPQKRISITLSKTDEDKRAIEFKENI
jgi:tRNA threonylcarbamoyl adenosine modification protein YjeE